MTKRVLQQLVLASYHKNTLQADIAEKISNLLSKKDLKAYIRALKLMEQKHKISVATPDTKLYNTAKKSLEEIFPNKEITLTEDDSLLLGMQVVANDMIYDMSLKQELHSIVDEVIEQYE